MPRDQSPVLPSSITVAFPVRRCGGHPADGFPQWYTKRVTLAEGGFPNLSGYPGSHTLHCEALALYSTPVGPPSNQAALDALALQMATDFYSWRPVGFDRVYNGIVVPTPNALIDTITWTYSAVPHDDGTGYGDAEPITGGCLTRVRSAPLGSEPERYQHQDPAVAGCIDDPGGAFVVDKTPCVEMYGPNGPTFDGHTNLRRYKVCLEGGRLTVTHGLLDSLDCGCINCDSAQICATIVGCVTNSPVSGATVTVTGPDSFSDTCTTDSSGQCCITIPNSLGEFTVTATGLNGSQDQTTVNAQCGTNNVTLHMPAVQAWVRGCSTLNLPDATVSVFDGATLIGTCTTNSDGVCTVFVPDGTKSYTITVTADRFQDLTKTCTGCGTCIFQLTEQSDYCCIGPACVYPLAKTLTLTSLRFGTTTLTATTCGTWTGTLLGPTVCNDPCSGRSILFTISFNGTMLFFGGHFGHDGTESCCPGEVDDGCNGTGFTLSYGQPNTTICPPSFTMQWIDRSLDVGGVGMPCLVTPGTTDTVTITE